MVLHVEALRLSAGLGASSHDVAMLLDALAACAVYFERLAHAALLAQVFALHAWTCPAVRNAVLQAHQSALLSCWHSPRTCQPKQRRPVCPGLR